MEENEYWEFNVDELSGCYSALKTALKSFIWAGLDRPLASSRLPDVLAPTLDWLSHLCLQRTFLLKFLCDELLNSAVIRQHLEHCSETLAELQQKLRSLSAEWKNLKSKEEILIAKAAKVDPSLKKTAHALSGRSNSFNVVSDDLPALEGARGLDKHPSASNAEYSSQHSVDTEARAKDVHAAVHDTSTPGNVSSNAASEKSDISSRLIEFPSSNSLPHEINGSIGKIGCLGHPQDNMEMDVSLPLDQQGVCIPSDVRSNHVGQHTSPASVNESQSYHLELNSVKSDLSLLQDSITSVDFELSKLSARRSFWELILWVAYTGLQDILGLL
ncbi:hypothetical protein GBA52_028814 [Prunus armeniaca]|nr:hypothetical protein GBA52_028814 [Prunus armeniaca]